MISLLVAYLALFNRWLDDGGTVANFYDKPGLTHRLQGNVEFMRQFGRGGGGGGGKKQFIPWVSTLLRRTYVCFDKESHGSSIHPDLNMSEFSKLAIGKSCLGKVVRFFYSFTLRRMGRPAPFYEGYLFCFFGGERSPKNNYQLHSIIGVARHLWRRCLSFCGKWKLWHRWPKYLSHGNRAFSEKRRKHFPTFSLLSLLDSLTHTSHGRGR